MRNIFYFDDALNSPSQNLEKYTLNYLTKQFPLYLVRGFSTEREIFHYFFNFNNPLPDLYIWDFNLYWKRDDSFPWGFEFRYSDQLISYLKMIRGQIKPNLIYSDDNTAKVRYRNAYIPFVNFVPKWGDKPWELLTLEAKKILEISHPIEKQF